MKMNILSGVICQNTVKGWRVVGHIVYIAKVLVPLLIIITSVVPLFNALVKGSVDETIKSWKMVGKKLAAGVIIFLIPSLIENSVNLLANKEMKNDDVMICIHCFSSPNGKDCLDAVNDYDTAEEQEVKEVKEQNEKDKNDSKVEGGTVETDNMGSSSSSVN